MGVDMAIHKSRYITKKKAATMRPQAMTHRNPQLSRLFLYHHLMYETTFSIRFANTCFALIEQQTS